MLSDPERSTSVDRALDDETASGCAAQAGRVTQSSSSRGPSRLPLKHRDASDDEDAFFGGPGQHHKTSPTFFDAASSVARVVERLRSMRITPASGSDYDIGHATGYANCRNDIARSLGVTL